MNEYDFAEIIGGEVNLGASTAKKDVIDQQHRSHSVKSGTWWQIFLYARARLLSNTILMGIGDLAEIMTQCLDAFPESRADYTDDKMAAKRRLQEPMRRLKLEMEKPNIFPALLNKSFFNGGEVDYLSVLPRELPNTLPVDEKHFHIFHQCDVVRLLTEHLEIRNSKANNPTQMDDQKVIFRYNKNVGEIEIRTDSDRHYREVKWRMNAESIFKILAAHLESDSQSYKQVTVYGSARRTFSIA